MPSLGDVPEIQVNLAQVPWLVTYERATSKRQARFTRTRGPRLVERNENIGGFSTHDFMHHA